MKVNAVVPVLAVLLLAPFPGTAQTANPDGDEAPPSDYSFGSGTQDFVVQAHACHERLASPRWIQWSAAFFGSDTAVAAQYGCAVTLPSGARVTGLECFVRDASAIGDLQIVFNQSKIDGVTGAPLISSTLASISSAGATGYQVVGTTLPTPVTLRHRNGNERYHYWLFLSFPADVAANISFSNCTIFWNRQVAPAPATATFSDVPVGHAQRQFVEALVAAGITGGCSASAYCPDSPVTRGQMAVFLAVALGLHFPN